MGPNSDEPTKPSGARVITSFGPLVAGLLAAPFGGNFNKHAALMTCFALLSIYAMYLSPRRPAATLTQKRPRRDPCGGLRLPAIAPSPGNAVDRRPRP